MADFDPNAYAADEPAPPPSVAPAFDPNAYAADEPAVQNLGVLPMPSRAQHQAALVQPPTALDTAPGAYTLGGPEFTAFQATHSGVNGDQAAQALKLAKRTGFAPEMVARNLDALQQRVDQTGFEDGLGAAPATAAYAAQSPIHAALVKDDVGPLEALEQGLLDVGYQVAATKEMTFPSAETEQNLLSAEATTSIYEKRPSGIIARGIRDIPTLATYYGAGLLGKRFGGGAGEVSANIGAMFLLNRGTLYRQIMQQMPYPETDEQGTIGVGAYDQVAYEKRARIYATAGAGASAVLATGISHAVGMALPAITTRVNGLSNGIIARAFTDPATRDVIANLIGKTVETEGGKVVTGAAGWGGHTLAGALAMAIPAVVDDATVQQALKGTIDPGKAAAAGWEAFKNALLAAATLSALPHVVPTVRNVGRAAMAPFDAARLDHNVEKIQAAKITTRNPEEAEKLVGRMVGQSDAPTVFVSPEAMADPKLAAKVADAAGPHAVGDAQVTGGDIAVPAEKYLVRLNGDHAALRENVKTIEDGATLNEARAAEPNEQVLFRPAFRNPESGQVIVTPGVHDISKVPGFRWGPSDAPEEGANWTTGFVDSAGAFLTRKGAADALRSLGREPMGGGNELDSFDPGIRVKQDTLTSLMADRSWIVQTEKDSPERTAKLAAIEERMRGVASRGPGRTGAGRVATEEEMKQAAADYAQMKPPGEPSDKFPQVPSMEAVDGLRVRDEVPNMGSIGSSLNDHEVLPGIRRISTSAFEVPPDSHPDAATKDLAEQIRQSGELNPLIVVVDKNGPYVLEGGHRYDAMGVLGKKEFPAVVVIDRDPKTGIPRGEPAAATAPAYEVPKPPKVTADDEATAREHIEGKTVGEIRPSYYETQARRAGERALKLATGPDPENDRILTKYAEAMDVSLDAVRNAVQTAFRGPDVDKIGPDTKGEAILKKYAEALNVSLDTVRKAVAGFYPVYEAPLSADTVLRQAAKEIRGAERSTNALESGRLQELRGLEAEYEQHLKERQSKIEAQRTSLVTARKALLGAESEANKLEAGRMATLQKLEAEHAMNVANRQASINEAVAHQKNAKLFAGVAREIRTEMDRTEEKILKKADDADFLATLRRAGPEYRDAHDAIAAALWSGPEPAAQPGAIDPLIDRLQRDGLPLGFDPDHIRGLLEDPVQWKDLTPAEARNVADAMDNIRTAAKTVNSIALGDRRQSLRDFVDGVRAHLDVGGVPDKGLPAPSDAGVGRFDKIKEGASALAAELLRPETILGRLGPDGERLFDTFVKARNQKEEFARQIGDFFTKVYEQELPKALKKSRLDGVTGPASPVVADDKWVRQDLWTLAGWYGSESGADRLRLGLKLSDEQIQTALSQLTKPEAELINALHALHDEKLFPLIRDHEVANTGASAPKIDGRPFTIQLADGEMHTFRGGYWPAKYRGKAAPEAPSEPASIEDYWGALKNGFPTTSKSFTKERVAKFEGMPDLNWSSYAGHINSVLHYLSYDDFVRNTGKVFQDPEFRDIVQRRLGDQEMRELDKFVGVAARGKVEAPTDGAAKWSAMVGGGFRSRVATGAFQLNLPVVLGQLSHIPAMMAGLRIGPGDMLQGLGKAFIPSSWDADHAESQQLPYRWNGYGSHMREMLSSIGPGDKPLGRKWLDSLGWSLYHAMDGFISKIIYGAAKAKAQSNWFSGEGLTGQDAIDYADRALSRAMPPLNIAEQSSIVRDRGLMGSLLLVRNFPNTLYNVGAVNAWQAKTGIWAADPGWQRTMAKLGGTTAAAASYLGMVWGAHIFGRFLMGHGRQEDESTSDWLEREALAAPFYPIPIAGDVAAPISEAIVSPTKTLEQTIRRGLHAAPVVALLEGSIREFGKAVGDKGTDTDKAFAAAKLAATALRLPVYPLRPARYTLDLFSGEASPRGPWDVAGGLFYGQRDRQTRNPLTTAQDVASGEFQ